MIKFSIVIALILVLLLVAVAAMQRRLMYFPTHAMIDLATVAPFQELRVENQHWGYILEREPARKVVVFLHGNAGEAGHRIWVGDLVQDPAAMIILAEYPGYGHRPGQATQANLSQALEDLLDYVAQKYSLPVTLLAESIGTGVAASVAHHPTVKKLAFIAPFTSALAVAQQAYPFLPVRYILQDTWDSQEYLKNVSLPLLVIHGCEDRIIPCEHGRELVAGYTAKEKEFIAIPGVGHNDIVPTLLQSERAESFRKFIND